MQGPKKRSRLAVHRRRRTISVGTAERVAREMAVVQERANIRSYRATKLPLVCAMMAI